MAAKHQGGTQLTLPMLSPPIQRVLAFAWCCLLAFGVLSAWIAQRWALAVFEGGFFALGAICCCAYAYRPFRVEFPAVAAVPWAAVAIGALQLSSGWTVNRWETAAAMAHWATFGLVIVIAAQFAVRANVRDAARNGLLWFAAAVAVVGIVQYFTAGGKVFWLFQPDPPVAPLGPFLYRNKYAQFVELFIPITLHRAIERPRVAIAWFVLGMGMLAGSIGSGSRSGFVVGIVETAVFFGLVGMGGRLERGRVLRSVAQVGALLVLAGGVVGWEFLQSRFQSDIRENARLPIALATIDMIRERPFTGFGLGTFSSAYGEFARLDTGLRVNQAHCDWLQWPAEGGLGLFLLMLAVGALALRIAWACPWCLGVPVVLLHGLVDYPMQQVPQFAALVWAMLALGYADFRSLGQKGSFARPLYDRAGRSEAR